MKHLISLSLKYIRRQKLRTALTFMCVTLSVFILCSFGAYLGSIVQTMKNSETRQFGAYEADITEWIDQMESGDQDKALKTIADHAAVSDYCAFYQEYFDYQLSNNKPEPDGRFSFLEFSDGKNTARLRFLTYKSAAGNASLCGQYGLYNPNSVTNNIDYDAGDGYIVPSWLQDMGYSEGDTITFTLKNVNAAYDEDSEIIKSAREENMKEKGSSVFADDAGYNELDYEEKRKASRVSLASHLIYNKDIQFKDIPITEEMFGETHEYTIKIAGFNDCTNDDMLIRANNGISPMFNSLRTDSDAESSGIQNTFVRINENLDIDDGLHMLFEDLGFSAGDYELYPPVLNNYLLLLEFRLSSGIVSYIPMIALISVIVLLIWLLARFVIDNAFEISAKERSSQYGLLRVLGTSKGQTAALVFTEAVFYMMTAVPTGMALAYLVCYSSVSALRNVGFVDFEFCINPVIAAISVFLCILAIFISAYTSAMWAARKLSPAETLNFGKPKSRKKVRRHKSRLKLGSKRFFLRYIGKNIMRSKSRYFISTITMTIGVYLFTFIMIAGLDLGKEFMREFDSEDSMADFTVTLYDNMCVDEIDSEFRNNDLFSRVEVKGAIIPGFSAEDTDSSDEKLREFIKSVSFYDADYYQDLISFVDIAYYDQYLAEPLGMTFEEFSALDGVIFRQSIYGPKDENGEQSAHEEGYWKFDESDIFDAKPKRGDKIKIIGTMCDKRANNGFIASINSELAKKYCNDVWVRLNVNGSKNYLEAEKMYMEFTTKYGAEGNSENYYMFSTGLSEFVKAVVKMVLTLVGAIWAVGILSMVNSINTGVLNRSKELLMLRSVGMTRKQMKRTIILESVMFSALSSALGIMLASASYVIFMQANGGKVSFAGLGGAIIITALVNILIAAAAAVPGIRSLEKSESLVKYAN